MPFVPNAADAATSGAASQADLDSVDFAMLLAGIAGAGVLSGCAVTAQGTPDMTLAVASGTARIAGAEVTVTAGNVTVTANGSSDPRFDLVAVNDSGTKSVQAGTAAANPTFPAIPASSIVLAAILVPPGASAIAADKIVDKRVVVGLGALAPLSTITTAEITDGTVVNADINASAAIALTKLADVVSDGSNFGIGSTNLTAITTGTDNVAFGIAVLDAATSGASNVGVGANALGSLTTGSNNVAAGYFAGRALTTGINCFALGTYSLFSETTGSDHLAIGNNALFSVAGAVGNVGLGSGAGVSLSTGSYNTLIGFRAWDAAAATVGSYNTVIGADADLTGGVSIAGTTAVGGLAAVGGDFAMSLGYLASATGAGSVAIGTDNTGTGASTSTTNGIRLGTALHQVTIIGKAAIGAVGSYGGGGTGVLFIANAGTNPSSDPSGGGVLYAESGALKWRGSSGTVTTIAAA